MNISTDIAQRFNLVFSSFTIRTVEKNSIILKIAKSLYFETMFMKLFIMRVYF